MPKVSDDRLAARRAEILAAARRAFARHGYEGATVKVLETDEKGRVKLSMKALIDRDQPQQPQHPAHQD